MFCPKHPNGGTKCFDCASGALNATTNSLSLFQIDNEQSKVNEEESNLSGLAKTIQHKYIPYISMDSGLFLSKFTPDEQGQTIVDINNDGYVDKKELSISFIDSNASLAEAHILIDAFFSVLDVNREGKIRTDVFRKEYINMGIYNSLFNLKRFVDDGSLHMLTKLNGVRDVFFTKDELHLAFEKELGIQISSDILDETFKNVDINNSQFMNIDELYTWYYAHTIHSRTIDLKRRMFSLSSGMLVSCSHLSVLKLIESSVEEIKTLIMDKKRKEKKLLKRKGSHENIILNRMVGKLSGLVECLETMGLRDENNDLFFDHGLKDYLLVPILEAYRLGAYDPNAPIVTVDSDDED